MLCTQPTWILSPEHCRAGPQAQSGAVPELCLVRPRSRKKKPAGPERVESVVTGSASVPSTAAPAPSATSHPKHVGAQPRPSPGIWAPRAVSGAGGPWHHAPTMPSAPHPSIQGDPIQGVTQHPSASLRAQSSPLKCTRLFPQIHCSPPILEATPFSPACPPGRGDTQTHLPASQPSLLGFWREHQLSVGVPDRPLPQRPHLPVEGRVSRGISPQQVPAPCTLHGISWVGRSSRKHRASAEAGDVGALGQDPIPPDPEPRQPQSLWRKRQRQGSLWGQGRRARSAAPPHKTQSRQVLSEQARGLLLRAPTGSEAARIPLLKEAFLQHVGLLGSAAAPAPTRQKAPSCWAQSS